MVGVMKVFYGGRMWKTGGSGEIGSTVATIVSLMGSAEGRRRNQSNNEKRVYLKGDILKSLPPPWPWGMCLMGYGEVMM